MFVATHTTAARQSAFKTLPNYHLQIMPSRSPYEALSNQYDVLSMR